MTALLAEQECILRELGRCLPSTGLVVGDFTCRIGRQPGRESNRKHTAYVSRLLLDLEKRGLIVRADEQKPILWRLKP